MVRNFIKNVAAKLGYEIKKTQVFDLDDEASDTIRKIQAHTMLPRERLVTLYQQAVFCEKHSVPGRYVECGVWKGGAVGLMAMANLKHGLERRHIDLFDSFQEICAPNASEDGEEVVERLRKKLGNVNVDGKLAPLKGVYDGIGGPGTLAENKELLEKIIGYEPDHLHYHVGWFQDTLPVVAPEIDRIAILRLDGDWYASTKICLEHLYNKVASGGFVIIDDYGAYAGCKKAVDEFMKANNINAYLSQVDSICRYWVKP